MSQSSQNTKCAEKRKDIKKPYEKKINSCTKADP